MLRRMLRRLKQPYPSFAKPPCPRLRACCASRIPAPPQLLLWNPQDQVVLLHVAQKGHPQRSGTLGQCFSGTSTAPGLSLGVAEQEAGGRRGWHRLYLYLYLYLYLHRRKQAGSLAAAWRAALAWEG